jgi:hypothetical protein
MADDEGEPWLSDEEHRLLQILAEPDGDDE